MADIRLCSFKVSQAVSSTPVTTMRAILLKKRLLFHCVGYAFKASRATDFLSITVLCLHIIVAWAHIIYLLTTRRCSDYWVRAEEMLTLALTSKTDTRILQNTCAFVKRFGTGSCCANQEGWGRNPLDGFGEEGEAGGGADACCCSGGIGR